jgi:hypothetical protein
MAHRHPCKLREAQLRVDFTDHIAQFGACMKKVVNFCDLGHDVEYLSGNSFRIWSAAPGSATCLPMSLFYVKSRPVKHLQNAPHWGCKNAASTGSTKMPSRPSVTFAPSGLIGIEETNRDIYGNDFDPGNAVDKVGNLRDFHDGQSPSAHEHGGPSAKSAVNSCDTKHYRDASRGGDAPRIRRG